MNNAQGTKKRDEPRRRVNAYLADTDNAAQVLAALEICDGHTIFDPQDFSMLPEFVRDHFSKVLPSASPSLNPKGVIYTDEGALEDDLFGIYGLELVEAAAKAHGVTSPKNGRGFRANDLKEQLRAKLAP